MSDSPDIVLETAGPPSELNQSATVARLGLLGVFLFWLPMAVTWMLMATEQPFIQAMVARLPEAISNLAAFGIAVNFCFVFESPIILMVSGANALVEDRSSYLRFRNFMLILSGGLSLLWGLLLTPWPFGFLSGTLLGLEPSVAEVARLAGLCLLPVPFVVGYRRFYQGILIRHNRPGLMLTGTCIRLGTIAVAAFGLWLTGVMNGAVLGALAYSAGMCAEALAARRMTQSILETGLAVDTPRGRELSYAGILQFYLPLAATSIILVASSPLLVFFLAHSAEPIPSLAIFPLLNSLTFFFHSLIIAVQELIIARLGAGHENFRVLRRFALVLGSAITLAFLGLMFSPLAQLFFEQVIGLSPELASLAIFPGRIASFIPPITLFVTWQRAVLVSARRTRPVTLGSAMELLGILFVAFGICRYMEALNGVSGAILAIMTGKLMTAACLWRPYRRLRVEVSYQPKAY